MKSIYDLFPEINATTAEDMAKQTGLDFTAIRAETFYKFTEPVAIPQEFLAGPLGDFADPKEREAVVPDKVAVIREDNGAYLGTVGRDRGILQYRDVLAFTEALVTKGEASYVTGGFIGNGEQAFVVMKTNKAVNLPDANDIDCYFYVTTSHDSSKGLELVPAPLVKGSGSIITLPERCRIKFRHTKNVEARVNKAAMSLHKVNSYFDEMESSFQLLRNVRLNNSQLDTYLKVIVPDPDGNTKRAENIRAEILTLFNTSTVCNLPSTKGTMLGAYFAVIEFVDHIKTVKKSKVRPNEYDAKIHSSLEGHGASQKANAYAFALDMVRQLKGVSLASSLVDNSSTSSL